MRRVASCLGVAWMVAAGSGTAAGNELGLAAGVSIGGLPAYGKDLNGSGPVVEVEVGLTHSWSAALEVRRHWLTELPTDQAAAGAAAVTGASRDLAITVRHAMFMIGAHRYLDLHAGLGAEHIEVEGHRPRWRRYAQLGLNMLQPGSMYHLTDHLELRFGVDVVVAQALREGGEARGCTGPCTTATAGPAHDVGVFGTITVGIR